MKNIILCSYLLLFTAQSGAVMTTYFINADNTLTNGLPCNYSIQTGCWLTLKTFATMDDLNSLEIKRKQSLDVNNNTEYYLKDNTKNLVEIQKRYAATIDLERKALHEYINDKGNHISRVAQALSTKNDTAVIRQNMKNKYMQLFMIHTKQSRGL